MIALIENRILVGHVLYTNKKYKLGDIVVSKEESRRKKVIRLEEESVKND